MKDLSDANDRAIDAHTNELGDEAKREEEIAELAADLDDAMKKKFYPFVAALGTITDGASIDDMGALFNSYKSGDHASIGQAFEHLMHISNYNFAKKELES